MLKVLPLETVRILEDGRQKTLFKVFSFNESLEEVHFIGTKEEVFYFIRFFIESINEMKKESEYVR